MAGGLGNLRLRYPLLGAVSLAAVIYQVQTTAEFVRQMSDQRPGYGVPFLLRRGTRIVDRVDKPALDAGIRPGDEVLAINGEPLRGYSLFARMGGPDVQFRIRRGGAEFTAMALLSPQGRSFTPLQERLISGVLVVAMPWLCTLLGVWAAAIRPRDPQAWLLLALMLSFPHLVDVDLSFREGPIRIFSIVYHRLMGALMPVAMVLFAIYFAVRFPLDARAPWLKWLILAPSAAGGLGITFVALFQLEAIDVAAKYASALAPWPALYGVTTFVSIGLFFMVMGWKFGITTALDARRRLKLLLWGTTVAMAPLFLIIVTALAARTPVTSVAPAWLLTAALLTMFLFPLTITYVIVVHRALDVRVVLRQGIQYALAREGAKIMGILAGTAVLLLSITLALDESRSRPEKYTLIGLGVLILFLIQRLRLSIAAWIDRRFFRQAYDTERILSELSEEVRTVVDEPSLLKRVGETISSSLFVPRLAFFVADNGAYRTAFALGYPGTPEVAFPESCATVAQLRQASAPAPVYFDDDKSWIYRTPEMTDEERRMLASLESQLILPLAVKEKLVGFLSLGQKRSEEPYSGSDLRLLRSLAVQTGLALENSRLASAIAHEAAQRERLNREVEIAREVQQRLFPQKVPQVTGLDCAGGCRPALGVGGDYYDFLELPEGRLGVVIGDVSGKGIAAALLMASLQASVRGQTLHESKTLATVIGHVNSLIYEASASSRYATLFYAQIDPVARTLDYVNAGHNPPLLLRATGEIERLETGGTVVGLLPRFPYQQGSVTLLPGDLLLSFTDGISEAMNASDEEWGEDRLVEAVRKAPGHSAAELIPYIIEKADEFVAGAPQHDDMTLVIVRVS